MRGMRGLLGSMLGASVLGLAVAPPAVAVEDHAGEAYNILPPGQSGQVPPANENARDQMRMYDALTPLFGEVSARDVRRLFKPNVFGTRNQGPTRREATPRGDRLRIVRDRYGVPHINGRSRDDVMYGAGWASAEDRAAIMEALRAPARLAVFDSQDAASTIAQVVSSGQTFVPSAQTEAFMARQTQVLLQRGARGRRLLRDVDQYLAGINANYRARNRPHAPWTRNDVYAMVTLLAGVFGQGGGDEARRSELLDALRQRLGRERGWNVWDDLRQQYDEETDVSLTRRFSYGRKIRHGGPGNAVIDDGSLTRTGLGIPGTGVLDQITGALPATSNALLVSGRRSATGRPLFVAGPQVGFFYPQILMEMDLHGGGIDARGVGVPGFALALVIGRGKDFVWSLTSASNDLVDEYVETLCGNDFTYRYKGECRPMGVFDAGTVEGSVTSPETARVTFRSTVHGPVVGYATVGGRRVAISRKRSTRGREIVSAFAIEDLMTNRIRSAADFRRVVSRDFEPTFNFFYADDRDVAMVSTGRLPRRPAGVDTGLPTIGDGRFEWQGYISPEEHPQQTRRDGVILNWNNKPARGWTAADDVWHFGPVVRNDMFHDDIERRRRHTLATVTGAMNRAATQDIRNDQVLPAIDAVLRTGPAPSARSRRMLELLRDWRTRGSSRLDRDLDGDIDHPGAAIMDTAWEKLADAVMEPVLGPQLDQLARLHTRDNAASSQGSAYNAGWYSYVDKDLRYLVQRSPGARRARTARVPDPYTARYCGNGNLERCRTSLWAAMEEAGEELEESEGTPDPDRWRADAQSERIRFLPGLLPDTMRFTNRPTFQQVIEFRSHRGRPAQRQAPARRPAGRRPSYTG
jgi:acyl-homoserine lactone acylase PvdQ